MCLTDLGPPGSWLLADLQVDLGPGLLRARPGAGRGEGRGGAGEGGGDGRRVTGGQPRNFFRTRCLFLPCFFLFPFAFSPPTAA